MSESSAPRSPALVVLIPLIGALCAGAAPELRSGAAADAGVEEQSAADLLMQVWPGVRDSSEQLLVSPDRGPASFSDQQQLRIRTSVARVQVPWMGLRVLYLEEFLHDEPSKLRRQVLLRLEPDPLGGRRVRAYPYTFRNPQAWRQLNRNPRLQAALSPADVEETAGCDLVFHQEGDQFRGATTGPDCEDESRVGPLYVDYRLVIGTDIYWYRRRLLRDSNDELVEEVMGYNWFEANGTRLFTCRVQWSASGKLTDLRELVRLDLHDQGGHARFSTPDGRKFEVSLHSEDWPFATDRDALILVLEDPVSATPLASAWTGLDERQIAIDLGWMNVTCGPLVPETGEVAS